MRNRNYCNNSPPLTHSQRHRDKHLERFEESGTTIQHRPEVLGKSRLPQDTRTMRPVLEGCSQECMHGQHTFLPLSSSDVSTPRRAAKGRSTSIRDCCALSPSCATHRYIRLCTSTARRKAPSRQEGGKQSARHRQLKSPVSATTDFRLFGKDPTRLVLPKAGCVHDPRMYHWSFLNPSLSCSTNVRTFKHLLSKWIA